jgi:hypothetical protein
MQGSSSISWSEIRQRALHFAHEWKGESRESAEKQSFWNDFFKVFGLERRSVASFEEPVRNIKGKYGFIDLFWKGVVLVEHKSQGKDLSAAKSQAFQYIQDLLRAGEREVIPRYVIISDFESFALHDLDSDSNSVEFALRELPQNVKSFAFLRGETSLRLDPEDPANEKACMVMADLHDKLKSGGFDEHELERFLVRVLFCLFAEDTGIFEPSSFTSFIKNYTRPDGSDLGAQLNALFEVLNTPGHKRQKGLDDSLVIFPYVNGQLFAERLGFANFNSLMRSSLIECCEFQWAKISPAVFGSLFQGVMASKARRQVGAHYTSERDILKLIRSLFLDQLKEELEAILDDRSNRRASNLKAFQLKLRSLRFLDPACGCGNFLILAYRELRRLELRVLLERFPAQQVTDIKSVCSVDVDQFYGIEFLEWPVRIAEIGMWLIDHQMNREVAEAMGQSFVRLPLQAAPHIVHANALKIAWEDVLSPKDCSFILGNPPFVGKKEQSDTQKDDMRQIWGKTKGAGNLDYVTGWYLKTAQYIKNSEVRCAFVSTNSISQGEQVGTLWSELFGKYRLKIYFAHRTFAWQSETKGKANVHVVIIGFCSQDISPKYLYEYEKLKGEPVVSVVTNINPYLVEGGDVFIRSRSSPLNGAPKVSYGSMMIDKERSAGVDEGLILSSESRKQILEEAPAFEPYIRRLFGGDEFLNGTERWCLWLVGAPPELLRMSQLVHARIEKVREFRAHSKRPQTKALASTPSLFGEIRQPNSTYLLIPKVSSETRFYLPIGFMDPSSIASGSTLIIPDANLYHFGILSSNMHNAWMRTVAGRMKSDYQYSANIVYNNFPWPADLQGSEKIEDAAQAVIEERAKFPNSTLAALYDPIAMPSTLAKAHAVLDKMVDKAYRSKPFQSDRKRVEFLFELFERIDCPVVSDLSSHRNGKGRRRSQISISD